MSAVLLAEQLVVLFAITAIGAWLGQRTLGGVSLGPAGVLFCALAMGHLGFHVPRELMVLGLILFTYAVGLQAGPRFFRAFRRTGLRVVVASFVTATVGAATTTAVARLFRLSADLACGLYAGALTSTPAFAAAIDAFSHDGPEHSANVSVGYGMAYPFAIVWLVVLVQLLTRLGAREALLEEALWSAELAAESPELETKTFIVRNPECDGKSLSELDARRENGANICRLRRDDEVFIMSSGFPLRLGDVVMATGHRRELEKLGRLLGEETRVPMDLNREIVSEVVDVTNRKLGRTTLAELQVRQRFGVVITSIRRHRIELAPHGGARLELGDSIVVVGDRPAVKALVDLVNPGRGKPDETSMVPFLLGLAVGVGLGSIALQLPNGMTLKLDSAGGVFVTSLLLGYLGKVGSFRFFAPAAATNFARELGLTLFLAGAGTIAGTRFAEVLRARGPSLLIIGALITLVAVAATLLTLRWCYRMRMPTLGGTLAACMTNSAGLAAAAANTRTDLPMLAFASTYPVALIFKVVWVQVLADVMHRLL